MDFAGKPDIASRARSGNVRSAHFAGNCRLLRRVFFLSALTAIAFTRHAEAADELRNWFNDPFFQISDGLPGCPLPAGPFLTDRERQSQAHWRAEKGTTCWLARDCDRPNAFAYDPDIAAAMQATARQDKPFADSSLWATVQARVVYIEGCVAHPSKVAEIEAFARAQPFVEQVFVFVRSDPSARPPYRLRVER